MRRLVFLLLLFGPVALLAQMHEPHRGYLSTLFSKNLRFIANPIIQNSPETGLKLGVAANYFFHPHGDTLSRTSNAYLQVAYTTRNQFIFEPIWNIFTRHETWILRGRAGFLDFYDQYWEIGPLSDASSLRYLRYRREYLNGKVLRNLGQSYFAGVHLRYSHLYAMQWNSAIPEVQGNTGSWIGGFGPNFQIDRRDNPFSPQKGYYLDVYLNRFFDWHPRAFSFNEYQFDFRYYLPTGLPQRVLALQAFGLFTDGSAPFRELPRLGSAFMMRGFFEGRYRDRQHVAVQAEWRQPLWKRLHGSVFLAAGEVAPQLHAFRTEALKVSGGAGLRLLLNPKDHVFARFDLAFNNEGGYGFCIRINDAF